MVYVIHIRALQQSVVLRRCAIYVLLTCILTSVC